MVIVLPEMPIDQRMARNARPQKRCGQVRNGLIHILDYKPDAHKVNPVSQLVIYALALASRSRLPLRDFKCAWFDERTYFEFFPLHAVFAK